ncbi:winged helix-turn-helix domain-containing protein [Natrononativus amylolyticus]|uniref:winged helix-turn-helix domain-containing protein n=1 Tax=Natrononativus amylolyticus TaxID=2963434 RepID=UPI0020CF1004|nr:winged helix-turn-helix domain-containing protein [Natrononativus amylolyticus]
MSEQFVQHVEPEEAFAALTDETRLKILQVLWESDIQTVTFSELRRAVGMRDPGQFNYHLDKLVGQFVTKTDEGYRLTQAGKHVNGAIASGMYTAHGTIDPIVLDHSCQKSGEAIMLRYENETVQVGCGSCSFCPSGWKAPVPPAVFAGYDRDEIPEVVSRYFRTKVQQVTNGFCPYCNGQMKSAVKLFDTMGDGPSPADRSEELNDLSLDPVVRFDCQRCSARSRIALYHALLLTDPVVTSFYCENGVVVQERPIWEISELSPARIDIESRNPVQVNVMYRVDESTLIIVVDETFNIVDIEK